MERLRRFWSRSEFALAPFELAPLEFEPKDATPGELFSDEVVVSIDNQACAPRPLRPLPTAGELRARIERHLHRVQDSAPAVDAAAELRQALSELRRSIG